MRDGRLAPNCGRSRSTNVRGERLPPRHAVAVAGRQVGAREASPEPEPVMAGAADLGRLQAGQFQVLDAPGQRFRGLAQQLGTGAAQDQEPRARFVTIHQYPQDREQLGPALHLVDDDRAGKVPQRGVRLIEAREAYRILQVEVAGRPGGNELPGERGLAALARPDDGDDRAAPEPVPDFTKGDARDHALCSTMKIDNRPSFFHGCTGRRLVPAHARAATVVQQARGWRRRSGPGLSSMPRGR